MSGVIRKRGQHVLSLGALFGVLAGLLLVCQAALAGGDATCEGSAEASGIDRRGNPTGWVMGSFNCSDTCGSEPCVMHQLKKDGQTATKNADCTTTVTTKLECRCEPSGAGSEGCSEVWTVTSTVGADGVPAGAPTGAMSCAGDCSGGTHCRLKRKPGRRFECKCQSAG